MTSSWGISWGLSWGNSWGNVGATAASAEEKKTLLGRGKKKQAYGIQELYFEYKLIEKDKKDREQKENELKLLEKKKDILLKKAQKIKPKTKKQKLKASKINYEINELLNKIQKNLLILEEIKLRQLKRNKIIALMLINYSSPFGVIARIA